jgi:PAS domain S-box-containing protein
MGIKRYNKGMKKASPGKEQREDALNEALKRIGDERAPLEAVIAAIGDGIRIIDPDFKILYENKVHRELLGEHTGEYCYQAYQGRNSVCERCPVAISFRDGGIHTMERTVPTEHGQRYIEITSSLLKDSEGRVIAGIEVVRDVTERKRLEAEREKLIIDLREALAKIRTLKGLIPVCAWCRKVRDDKGYWEELEHYIRDHTDADFTHGICPDCLKKNDPETYREYKKEIEKEFKTERRKSNKR